MTDDQKNDLATIKKNVDGVHDRLVALQNQLEAASDGMDNEHVLDCLSEANSALGQATFHLGEIND